MIPGMRVIAISHDERMKAEFREAAHGRQHGQREQGGDVVKITQADRGQTRGIRRNSLTDLPLRTHGCRRPQAGKRRVRHRVRQADHPSGGGWALEIKTRKEPTIAFNTKSITPNERRGLDAFMAKVGAAGCHHRDLATGRRRAGRAFVIPWAKVREAVCSGRRGSIRMTDWPAELQRTKGMGHRADRRWEIRIVIDSTLHVSDAPAWLEKDIESPR